jgi:NAD(P)-dependent dehydrogenase (short-subunit alcohol dehydrogenase family)
MRMRSALALGGAIAAGAYIARRNRKDDDMRGKVVAITGGSRGLGFLLAREFNRRGCRLAICARNEDGLRRAEFALRLDGAEVVATTCDVGDEDQVRNWLEATTAHYGHVDVLVNNAGIIQIGPVETQTVDDFRNALDVMYWGVVYPTLAVLPQMVARRSGTIVNITSIGGRVSVPHLLPYNSAKFAAVGFSEGLRSEVARHGVKVVTVSPGLMRTGSYLQGLFKGQHEQEFTWFALGASLPLISTDAERAARQITRAAASGQAVKIVSLPAEVIARVHGLMPGVTSNVLGLVNRLALPKADQPTVAEKGLYIQERLRSPALQYATTFGRSAARRFGEYTNGQREALKDTAAS